MKICFAKFMIFSFLVIAWITLVNLPPHSRLEFIFQGLSSNMHFMSISSSRVYMVFTLEYKSEIYMILFVNLEQTQILCTSHWDI